VILPVGFAPSFIPSVPESLRWKRKGEEIIKIINPAFA